MADEQRNDGVETANERFDDLASGEAVTTTDEAPGKETAPEENPIWSEAGSASEDDLERIAREMDTPAKKFARWNPKKRLWFERVAGFLLGAACGLSLSLIPGESNSFLSLNIVVPIVLALAVPRIVENKLQTQLKEFKKFMIIALGIYIAVLAVLAFTAGGTVI